MRDQQRVPVAAGRRADVNAASGAEQRIFAEHMEMLGLGVWLRPEDCEPRRLRSRIQAILVDRAMATRVRAAGEGLRQAGGLARAADLLSDFAVALRSP